jgi:hypothetical protein
VLYTDHHREGSGLPFVMVEVRMSVATRGDAHRKALFKALLASGIKVS